MAESTDTTEEVTALLTESEEDQLRSFLSGVAPTIAREGMNAYVFANDKKNPAPFAILDMIYQGVLTNTLGIMIAKHADSGVEVPVLVGISGVQGEDMTLFPVAMAIDQRASSTFLAPDGEGGYIKP